MGLPKSPPEVVVIFDDDLATLYTDRQRFSDAWQQCIIDSPMSDRVRCYKLTWTENEQFLNINALFEHYGDNRSSVRQECLTPEAIDRIEILNPVHALYVKGCRIGIDRAYIEDLVGVPGRFHVWKPNDGSALDILI